jgi:hypothetical protein
VILGGVDASDVVTVDVTQQFDGALGTFTLRAAITETAMRFARAGPVGSQASSSSRHRARYSSRSYRGPGP